MILSTYTKGQAMTTTLINDQDLIDAFNGVTTGKIYEATFIPLGCPNSVALWDRRFFKAQNKQEAVKIAREYGKRIINKKMVYVYVAGRSGW
jgi:hypothetical protein